MSLTLEKLVIQSLDDVKDKSGKIIITKSDIMHCLMDAIGKDKSYIIANHDVKIKNNQLIKFNFMLDSLKQGTPLAYVLGNQLFYNYKYYVNHDVLIPRPETEIIISEIISRGDNIFNSREKFNVIDAGSGSGCIGLSINSERNQWNIILIEKSVAATKILNKNYHLESRNNCHIVMGDWLSAFDENTANIIVSNPPYIEPESAEIDKSVIDYEPMMALFSKDQGLSDIRRIIVESRKVLKKDGLLFIENGFDQSDKVVEILKEHYYEDIDIILDYNNIKRFTISRSP
ncbi:MAG: peptide chain release factor N(5)-glutamine methyltransferase [Gammaproteobacteria bacterium]|jgi:release factor glutamine methyltransferase|nr:peptide chain release factor N(5)-glutamine methyltransferase [Gammaproteobacteria bacterium]MBT4462605.1 peptide chain release factor N(5)-glutamine methyltransferase [Gammaproteobacteria bacterium]MBT4654852.1 peptide chain release factor N(5)-glutamine methyltransferase [Gammaproteobacteria bacterium]MBT5116648.1 peptide chain release factor N(5)-glutamine methyltransferase [Gammaproteobacteria bacterium]MBT5761725.1 peptide chain release factor N(5)-glutamine methyltransferase [Gammaprot